MIGEIRGGYRLRYGFYARDEVEYSSLYLRIFCLYKNKLHEWGDIFDLQRF